VRLLKRAEAVAEDVRNNVGASLVLAIAALIVAVIALLIGVRVARSE
jgi:ABC-type dipeptide/oligopeptide/nickel transport system permease component